ncbi:MAG: Co2+/Mg2+ efflux protein ApaG [Saprospiraceae bacterium]
MLTATTKGIKISVETFYNPLHSRPSEHRYVFTYRITIENTSDFTVQLLKRHWSILDANGTKREVKGDGVVGVQPLIPQGESHQYVSWANMDTDIGKMYGTYLMERHIDGEMFEVEIPEFQLIAPFKMN